MVTKMIVIRMIVKIQGHKNTKVIIIITITNHNTGYGQTDVPGGQFRQVVADLDYTCAVYAECNGKVPKKPL
jgi:hypothetical protein